MPKEVPELNQQTLHATKLFEPHSGHLRASSLRSEYPHTPHRPDNRRYLAIAAQNSKVQPIANEPNTTEFMKRPGQYIEVGMIPSNAYGLKVMDLPFSDSDVPLNGARKRIPFGGSAGAVRYKVSELNSFTSYK